MPTETELKLAIDPQRLARLAAHPLFRNATQRVQRRLYSVYYDTPDLELWRAGVSLRVRRSGKQWTQTVKCGGGVTAGLHQRQEFEAAIPTAQPDFAVLEASTVAAYFSSPETRARLMPVTVTSFTRTSRILAPAAGVMIEASIDRGTVRSGDASLPLCEIELEVKEGPAWRAYEIGMQLLKSVPLIVEDRSKAERGIALYLGTADAPVKPSPSAVVAGMTTNQSFKALIESCIEHFAANQRGMLAAGDPEYLHQMRVALRRLRSVLSTYSPLLPPETTAPARAETRWLGRMLGAARDWDVFAIETLSPASTHYAGHRGLVQLTRATTRLRAGANRRARRAVASARGQGLLLALGAWTSAQTWLEALDGRQRAKFERPAIECAREVLDAALKRVRKRGKDFAELAPDGLHKLRIAAKKLRYASEFFAPLFDEGAARKYRDALARLQDALGAYNDAIKLTHLAERASRSLKGSPVTEARGIMLGWSAGRRDAGARGLKRLWRDIRAVKPFWR